MSNKNNVNKDFYTIAGRDRPNEDLVVTKPAQDDERQRRGSPRRNFIPGAAPVGESPAPRERSPGREGQSSAGESGGRSGARKKATAGRGEAAPRRARRKTGASGAGRGSRRRAPNQDPVIGEKAGRGQDGPARGLSYKRAAWRFSGGSQMLMWRVSGMMNRQMMKHTAGTTMG